jgi:hypothetical protein
MLTVCKRSEPASLAFQMQLIMHECCIAHSSQRRDAVADEAEVPRVVVAVEYVPLVLDRKGRYVARP